MGNGKVKKQSEQAPRKEVRFVNQPIAVSAGGTAFVSNEIVRALLERSGLTLDEALALSERAGDKMQFVQLVGMDVDEWLKLPFVTKRARRTAIVARLRARERAGDW